MIAAPHIKVFGLPLKEMLHIYIAHVVFKSWYGHADNDGIAMKLWWGFLSSTTHARKADLSHLSWALHPSRQVAVPHIYYHVIMQMSVVQCAMVSCSQFAQAGKV